MKEYFKKTSHTIASMCVDHQLGGISDQTFLSNLKLFVKDLENKVDSDKKTRAENPKG